MPPILASLGRYEVEQMVVGRLLAMALAAVGLSVGGFELGATKGTPAAGEIPADLPADHPITVALGTEVGAKLPHDERVRLLQMAKDMERERTVAVQVAAQQAKKKITQAEQELVRQRSALRELSLAEEASVKAAVLRNSKKQTDERVHLRESVLAEEARLRALQLQLTVVRTQLLKQQEETRRAEVERHYSDLALQQMAPKIREQVKSVVRTRRDMDEERGFGLLIALRNRDELGLTPAQVTTLQLLQADFIRRFAPIRQAYEERVDTLDTKVEDKSVTATPKRMWRYVPVKPLNVPAYTLKRGEGGKVAWKIYRENMPIETVPYVIEWQYPGKPKDGQAVIRYFVWTNDKDLMAHLRSLKSEIDEKAIKALNTAQRSKLKEMIDRSLATAK